MDHLEKSKKNKTKLNVLLIQFAPLTKKVKENIEKVNKMIEDLGEKDKIDIVVFPEMTFTGYIFDDKNDIKSCLEEQGKGLSFKFCSELAKR
jgi:protein N-terminal amidase